MTIIGITRGIFCSDHRTYFSQNVFLFCNFNIFSNESNIRKCLFQIVSFIDDLHSDHLRTQLHSQWVERHRNVFSLQLDHLTVTAAHLLQFGPSAFESHSETVRMDGFLDYPSVAGQLLTVHALQTSLGFLSTDEWTAEHESYVRWTDFAILRPTDCLIVFRSLRTLLDRLARFEDDTVAQFLVSYQHFEAVARVDDLLTNLMIVNRLRMSIADDLQEFLRLALQ